ncbi:MAG TPA: protein phosphatase 2C domain-containing protein [Thermoanaerobaculia bacterium]|nr:protein phosphatase 2C domain-containing protein [Thermoanaerobaculia bacterium]
MSPAHPPQAAAATDPGRERENNEDRVLCEPDLGIFAVIDGVGGASAGEVAAETALEVLRARLSRRTTDSARLVREAIALANRQIYERARGDARLAGMSCVLTVAVLDGAKVTVGQVGDSRLYALAPGEIRKVTPDHSPVGAREDAGDLSELEAMRHPRRNEIFRDVGSSPHEPDDARWIDVLEVPFDPGGALLLCSDGLSDMLPAREILETVETNASSPRAAVRALIERANLAGGKDNVSAVLVQGERFAEAVRRRRDGGRDGGAKDGGSGRSGGRFRDAGRGRDAGGAATALPAAGAARRAAGAAGTAATSGAAGTAGNLAAAGSPGRPLGAGSRAAGTTAAGAPGPASPSGRAAWARRSAGQRVKDSLPGSLGKSLVLAALLLAALAGYRYREPLGRWAKGLAGHFGDGGGAGGAGGAGSHGVLVVGTGDGGFATIGEALGRARPGETIEVAPGRYRERLVLRSGVALVSRIPRRAVLLPPPGEGEGPAVAASGVHGARLAGFRVEGTPQAPWGMGLRLDGCEVVIEEIEVSGAAGAGIEIRGADLSTVRFSYLHHNGGPGVAVTGTAAPRLLSNLIAGNGTRPGAPAAGVEVRDMASPLLAGNRIESNGGAGVALAGPDRAEEIFRWNTFGAVAREQAVRVTGGGAGDAATGTGAGAGGPGGAIAGRAPQAAAAHPAAARPAAAATPAPRRQRP